MPSLLVVLVSTATLLAATSTATTAPLLSLGPQPTRGLVIVLRPGDVDPLTRTALARVTGELAAARFQVIVLPLDPNLDPTRQVETVEPESNPVAVFAIAHIADADNDTVAIWVCDRLGRRTTIQRMAMRGTDISQDAEVLALEAIELIRVSIAGLWPPPPARPPTQELSAPPGPSPGVMGSPVSVGVGLAMLQDVGLASAQWMGSLIGTVKWSTRMVVRAQLTGLGPALTISGAYGNAAIHRELGSVGLAWTFWMRKHLQAFVSGAVGAERLRAAGSAADPTRIHTASVWSGLASAGVGVVAPLGSGGISLWAESSGMLTAPSLVVRIANTDTKEFSRPGVLVNVGLQASF